MSTVCQYLVQHGVALLAAATCLLAVGCMATALQRTPIHRQRAGELTVLAVLIWAVLACIPMPRYSLSETWSVVSAAWESMQPAQRSSLTEADPDALPHLPPTVSETAKALDESTAETGLPIADTKTITAEDPAQWKLLCEPELATASKSSSWNAQIEAPSASSAETAGVTTSILPASDPASAVDSRHVVWLFYVAGGLACLAWLILGRVLLLQILHSATSPAPWLQELYQAIPFCRRRPRLLVSPRCTRALSFSVWKPTIVLPASDCQEDRAGSIRHVLRHELAHVGQGDAWGHLLFNLAFPLLYFHPLYWRLRSQAYLAAELIADDWAAGRSAKTTYVEALVGLVRQRNGCSLAYFGFPQIFGSRSQFYRRMQMLLSREVPLAPRCSKLWRLIYPTVCLMAVLLAAAAVGVVPASGQEEAVATDKATSDRKMVFETDEAASDGEMAFETVTSPAGMAEVTDLAAEASGADVPEADKDREELQAALVAMRQELASLKRQLAKQQSAKDGRRKQFEDQQAARVQAAKDSAAAGSSLKQLFQKTQAVQQQSGTPKAVLQKPQTRAEQGKDTAGVMSLLQALGAGKAAKEKEAAMVEYKKALEANKATQELRAAIDLLRERGYVSESVAEDEGERLEIPSATLNTFRPSVRGSSGSAAGNATAKAWIPAFGDLSGGGRGQLDLVALATAYSDAIANLEVTKLQYEHLAQLQKTNTVSTQEVSIAAIQVKAAERKLTLLRRIAKSALKAAEVERGAVAAQYSREKKAGGNARQTLETQISQAQSRIEILRSILAAN
jgi:beta-lactamase regulating signal transducer with metallopeptidase domain